VKVAWTKSAVADLGSAYNFIAERSPGAAAKVIDRIEKAVAALARHPEIGRHGRVDGTRELIVPGTPFILPYRVTRKSVELLGLIHASRRWPDRLPTT
jgi:toxin ParE1/3/4